MSEENQGGEGGAEGSAAADPIKNIKAEMDRKLGNVDKTLSDLTKTNQQLAQALERLTKPAAPAPEPQKQRYSEDWFSNPDSAAEKLVQEAERRAEKKFEARLEQQNKQTQTLSSLVAEFPELTDGSAELTKKTLEIYNSLPAEDRSSPSAYRLAVKEAALELGVQPKSKRKRSESDDFSLSGEGRGPSRRDSAEVVKATEEFARIMGLKVDDNTKKNLKKHGARNWTRYE